MFYQFYGGLCVEIDLKDVLEQEQDVFKKFLEEFWLEVDPEYKKVKNFIDKYLKNLFNNYNRKKCWIYYKKERIGIIIYYFYSNLSSLEKNLHISEFFIKKEHRKKGVGTNTIKKLILLHPIQELRLEVLNSNQTGVAFWKSLGFDSWKYIMKKKLKGNNNDN